MNYLIKKIFVNKFKNEFKSVFDLFSIDKKKVLNLENFDFVEKML
jgi:hypothetical protein